MPVQQPAIPCHPLNRLQCSQPAAPPHCQQASSQCPSWRTQTALPAATCMAAARRPLEPARHPTAAARRTMAAARQVRAGQRGAALAVLVLQVVSNVGGINPADCVSAVFSLVLCLLWVPQGPPSPPLGPLSPCSVLLPCGTGVYMPPPPMMHHQHHQHQGHSGEYGMAHAGGRAGALKARRHSSDSLRLLLAMHGHQAGQLG